MKRKHIQLANVQLTMRRVFAEREQLPGFLRGVVSKAIKDAKVKTQAEWKRMEEYAAARIAEVEQRARELKKRQEEETFIRVAVVAKAREMIEWSYTSYAIEKKRQQGMMNKLSAVWELNWTPQRVLTRHQHFGKLCEALKDGTTWAMLSREERRDISQAFAMLKAEERASIAGAFIAGAVA